MGRNILITGGTGLIGKPLTEKLEGLGNTVRWLTRKIDPSIHRPQYLWDIEKGKIDASSMLDIDVIIHLAGSSISANRWNKKVLDEIETSRTNSTALLFDACHSVNHYPSHFISGSAIGFYGFDAGDKWLTEENDPGADYLADIVDRWEKSALNFRENGSILSWIRTGIVLARSKGALEKMSLPIKLGLGSPIGTGKQYLSWIHIDDQVGAIIHILNNKLEGTYNLVAPQPVTNREFTKELAVAYNRPLFMPRVPAFVLKIIVGQIANSILGSIKCSSQKLSDAGYPFKHNSLKTALGDLIR